MKRWIWNGICAISLGVLALLLAGHLRSQWRMMRFIERYPNAHIHDSYSFATFLGIPIPMTVAMSMAAVLPAIWVALAGRRLWLRKVYAGRIRRGCCISCGYDLRASTERCPECGNTIGLEERRS